MEEVQASKLKLGETYEVEFLNGFKLIVKFTGIKAGRYYFLNNDDNQFTIANNSVQYYRFYKLG
ncbi:hypothetical protein AB0758_46080 [Tolypothrix bouteillei VB521301_2]|uniref:hypothetical protein n=1 Tax=Tolypothrix bouteillei TaxID=1246981 RepID=UPI0005139EBA